MKNQTSLGLIVITVLLILAVVGCQQQFAPAPSTSPRVAPKIATEVPPTAPSNLSTEVISQSTVKLYWIDNSDNEEGFKIYRDNNIVATAGINITTYQDTGLRPGTTYKYMVKAYNRTGESGTLLCTVRTPNPPVTVRLNRIGVYDNRETWTRGKDGEVYVYVVISDGMKTPERMRFPKQEEQHYKLEKNETVDIGAIIFSVDEVGDSLTLTVIGYEDDGGGFEPLLYKALGAAIESQMAGGAGGLLEAFNFSLGGLIGEIFGAEDDWLGSYERTLNYNNNWGVGKYEDIALEDERGIQCLRLWFTITSP